MPFASSFISPRVLRAVLAAIALFACAAPAAAEPRLVRIIWDIGQQAVYYRVEPRTQVGHDTFLAPDNAMQAGRMQFLRQTASPFLRKGDRVRIYVVNYNSISHVWHESSVIEQVALSPSLVGPLLNALTLAISGLAKPPGPGLSPNFATLTDARAPADCPLPKLTGTLDTFREAARRLDDAARNFVDDAKRVGLSAAAKKLAAVPASRVLWQQFDSYAAWVQILTNPDVFGSNFETASEPLRNQLRPIQDIVDATNAALLAFDREIALPTDPIKDCVPAVKVLVSQRDNIVTLVREVGNDDSLLRGALAELETATTAWSTYKGKLEHHKWSADAVEQIVKDPIAAETVLRADAVFASPEKTVLDRTQRSLVIGVLPYIPPLVISSGIGYNTFAFKKLQVVKAVTTAADGSATTKNRLDTTDDTSWNRLMPVWIENIRLLELPGAGVYGTVGTTPDRNIFKNAIAGGSLLVPRWRTLFTAGMIVARGHDRDDLEPVIGEFTGMDGFALSDVSASNLPIPAAPWHKSFYCSVTFGLVSF